MPFSTPERSQERGERTTAGRNLGREWLKALLAELDQWEHLYYAVDVAE